VRLALPFIDVLIGNQPELMRVSGQRDLVAAVGALREAGVPMLVSKLGEQGTRVWGPPTGRLAATAGRSAATAGRLAATPGTIGDEAVFLPPYSVDVVSTIGAGDGFASGFLYALLGDKPVADCLHYGNAAAAIVVSRLSCSEAMPTLAEVEEMIRRQRS
jgi:5-dehydro-2-deoxygluconokinase